MLGRYTGGHSRRLHAAAAAGTTAFTAAAAASAAANASATAAVATATTATTPTPPSHDRLAVLNGAPADIPPFFELTLDDPDKRLSSGCFIARQLCGMGWRVAFNRLSQQVLHISAEDLAAMKAHLSAQAAANDNADTTTTADDSAGTRIGGDKSRGGCGYVSTNDAVVAFVWMLMRRLRRESEPGRGTPRKKLNGGGGGCSGCGDGGFVLQTIDMRGLGIRGLDPTLFGNASVMVAAHMPGGSQVERARDGGDCRDDDDVAAAAGAMARAMRSAVNAFKSKSEAEHRGSVLALASASTAVHLKSVITGVVLSDAFMSSWSGVFSFSSSSFFQTGRRPWRGRSRIICRTTRRETASWTESSNVVLFALVCYGITRVCM